MKAISKAFMRVPVKHILKQMNAHIQFAHKYTESRGGWVYLCDRQVTLATHGASYHCAHPQSHSN